MTKGQIIKDLKEQANGIKASFKDYDVKINVNSKEYFVKILKLRGKEQVTINSTIIWEIKSGKLDGVRFKPTSSRLINLAEFFKRKNTIIIFTEKPYRILKCLNEADVVDVSDEHIVYGTYYFDSVVDLLKKL